MLEYLYNFCSIFFDFLGLTSLLQSLFGERTITEVPLWDVLSVILGVVLSFVILAFLLKLFFSLIRKFLEVISHD